jgi:MoaA/NifB/PqqE/SkfB family radical SAM enzyme
MGQPKVTATRNHGRDRQVTVIATGLGLVTRYPDTAGRALATALGKVAKSDQQHMFADWIRDYLSPGGVGAEFARRVSRQVHPNVRKRFLAGFLANVFYRDPDVSERLKQEHGVNAPILLALSPSMRCNLRCTGCYAGEYDRKDDLPEEVVERVITEAEEIGTRFFIVIGGEPFMWPPLLDLVERHPDSVFQPYTNGLCIDEDVADRIIKLGNVAPALSIEGNRELTDRRRGKGVYDKVLGTMELLRDKGAIFSFSCTATRDNLDYIISDEFIDIMVEKGCLYGWYFTYAPVGLSPDLDYMCTAEERDTLRRGVQRIRREHPIIVSDFWNDGALTGGCLAAGRKYVHINNKGDVEPCVFCHFAVDNIKETSLVDALTSDFLQDLRKMQPFGHNLLRPCPLIDHPAVMRKMVEKHGAYATHPGAESLITWLQDGLHEYAKDLSRVYDPVWQEEYGWVETWLSTDNEYNRRSRRGHDAEEDAEVSVET